MIKPTSRIPVTQTRTIQTRIKIIKAARKLFVIHGYAGTSVGKIAAKANINHSLIFHHFGNKKGLWHAVKQSIVEESNKHSPTLPDHNQSFSVFIKQLITQNIGFYRKNPDIVRMINWQRLEYGDKKGIGITLSEGTKAWLNVLKKYQDNRDINPKLKLEFVLTLILSIISSAAMDPNIFIEQTSDLDCYIQFTTDRLLNALK